MSVQVFTQCQWNSTRRWVEVVRIELESVLIVFDFCSSSDVVVIFVAKAIRFIVFEYLVFTNKGIVIPFYQKKLIDDDMEHAYNWFLMSPFFD